MVNLLHVSKPNRFSQPQRVDSSALLGSRPLVSGLVHPIFDRKSPYTEMEVYPLEMEVLYGFIWENHGNISGISLWL